MQLNCTIYNPLLSNIKTIFKTHLPVLNSSQEMVQIANVTYRRNIKLKRAHPIFISYNYRKTRPVQLKNVTEDKIFVKVFLHYPFILLAMPPNVNIT